MTNRERLWATIVIWLPYTVIMTAFLLAATITGSLHEDTMFGIVLVISLAAAMAVRMVWRGLGQAEESAQGATTAQQHGKSKRYDQDRLARLIEELDQDEVIELETLLLARDES